MNMTAEELFDKTASQLVVPARDGVSLDEYLLRRANDGNRADVLACYGLAVRMARRLDAQGCERALVEASLLTRMHAACTAPHYMSDEVEEDTAPEYPYDASEEGDYAYQEALDSRD
jgi:hypothetical protein